jgi:Uma2 family endonuclease
MSTATTHPATAVPAPLEVPGPVTRVPAFEELERLTEVPDRRVVFRGVDWAFYEQLVDSIPESANIHVDYDGKDLEVMGKSRQHEIARKMMARFFETVADVLGIPFRDAGQTTWKRPAIARGLEADECYYFLPEKLAQDAAALERGSDDIADYPNPDLAIEVDVSRPQVDRAGIYAALRVAEVWRLDQANRVIIERLTPERKYAAVEASSFLPVRVEDVQRWIVEEDWRDVSAWLRRLRAEISQRAGGAAPGGRSTDSSPQNADPLPNA